MVTLHKRSQQMTGLRMCWVIEYDCGKSIYMNNIFLLYYWGNDNDCYYLTERSFLNLAKKTYFLYAIFVCTFHIFNNFKKVHTQTPHIFYVPPNTQKTPFDTNNNS